MLISYLCDVVLAHPAEMGLAINAFNVVAARYFLYRCHASGTAIELIPTIGRPLLKVQSFAFSTWMPLLTAFETHFIRTICAHGSIFTATRLFDC